MIIEERDSTNENYCYLSITDYYQAFIPKKTQVSGTGAVPNILGIR